MTKILISVDDNLLALIDRAAHTLGLSRSGYLSRLAAREVQAPFGPGRAAGARRALRRIEELFATNTHQDGMTEAVRRERDAH